MNPFEVFLRADLANPWVTTAFILVLGLCIGSFLNVCIYRIPQEKSVIFPGSHCACGKPIAWYDNLPGLSWLILRGKARCCGTRFSPRYLAIEWLTGILFVLLWRLRPPAEFIPLATLVSLLVAGSFIDYDHKIIPDRFTMGAMFLGVLFSVLVPGLHLNHGAVGGVHPAMRALLHAMIGVAVGTSVGAWTAFIAERVLGREAFGFADVKLLGALGAFLGWQGAVFSFFGGAVIGCVLIPATVLLRRARGSDGEKEIQGVEHPFGPSIALAGILFILWLQPNVAAYFQQFAPLFAIGR